MLNMEGTNNFEYQDEILHILLILDYDLSY